ncbi:MAG: amidohydrolase [Lacibacter sp.]
MRLIVWLLPLVVMACSSRKQADWLLINGTVYTVDSAFTKTEAIAVKDGRIVATGTTAELQRQFRADSTLDLQGAFVYPGFMDAHAHFYRYGLGLQECDLRGTQSWEEVLQRLAAFAANRPQGSWIIGRGWDQNNWPGKAFPINDALNRLFPDRPVLLTRIDGHAAIANAVALQLAGITAATRMVGGDVLVQKGVPTGVLIDNAVDLVTAKIPAPDSAFVQQALLAAQRNCIAAGLTSVVDCGLDYEHLQQIEAAYAGGKLKIRLNVMLSDAPANYKALFERGIIKTDRLHVCGFKVYADGALGSRGACLLHAYADRPGHYGFLLSNPAHFDSVAALLYEKGFQMNTHAIGDSGNRTVLNIYAKYLKGPNDRRWRIEHAQVLNPADFALFGRYNIIPSVQPTHATSDMYWAERRLGPQRIKTAYAWQSLLQQNRWLPLGTDFPVEDIDPLQTFIAAVFRQDKKGWPAGGFQMDEALTREQTLRGMTIWAAKGSFEEAEKGSIEKGKFADFTILDTDLMQADLKGVLQANVLYTIIQGEMLYRSK